MSGQEVEMQCQTDDRKKLKWYRLRPGSTKEGEQQIYNGYRFSSSADPYYAIYTSCDGKYCKYSLVFNASAETAMRYKCQEPGSLEEKIAEVISLVSDPRCSTVRDDAFINITCAIRFHGNWAPVMKWTRCNNETLITSGVSDSVVQHYSLSTFVRNSDDSGSCYRLTTLFRGAGRPLETSADNIPTYNHTICFKQPDWGSTSECDEVKKDDNSRETEVSTILSIFWGIRIPISAIIGLVIGIIGVIWCKKQSISKSDNRGYVQQGSDMYHYSTGNHAFYRALPARSNSRGLHIKSTEPETVV